jgi:hypothetical protein
MKESMLNIHFCGTQQHGAQKELASVKAITQFKNHLILSGVGSPDGVDPLTGEHYPTPGTFDVDEQLKRRKRVSRFGSHANFLHRIAGFAWGVGEEDNLAFAMAYLNKKLEQAPSSERFDITISGYSRGGATAVRFANKLYKKYGHQVNINMYLLDPNAGMGRHNYQHNRNIPPNVSNLYIVFNRDEKLPVIQSVSLPHYLTSSVTTRVTSLYLEGDHYDQEYTPEKKGPERASAEMNQELLELFYGSYGASRVDPNHKQRPFIKSPKIKTGFVPYQHSGTAVDLAIAQLDPHEGHQHPALLLKENEHLNQFNREIEGLNNPSYFELSYYFVHLLSEIERSKPTWSRKQMAKDQLLVATNQLIVCLTPSNQRTHAEQQAAFDNFTQCVGRHQYSEVIQQIVAHIVGILTGVCFGLAFGLGGFVTGLCNIQTFGLASIPYAAAGTYNGFLSGFDWGKRQILWHQNERHIEKTTRDILTKNKPCDDKTALSDKAKEKNPEEQTPSRDLNAGKSGA